jgi:hypothetical protein
MAKKFKYPFTLIAYQETTHGQLEYERKIILNKSEEQNFIRTYSPDYAIKYRRLIQDEIDSLPAIKRLLYITPPAVYWILLAVLLLLILI